MDEKDSSNPRKRKLDSAKQKSPKPTVHRHDSNDSAAESAEVHDRSAKSRNLDVDALTAEASDTKGQIESPKATINPQDVAPEGSQIKKARRDRSKAKAREKKRSAVESAGGEEELVSSEPAKKKQKETEDIIKQPKKSKKNKKAKAAK